MARQKTPLTTWLMLSLAVLLLHLALLQTLPLSLGNSTPDGPSLAFTTRTVTPAPAEPTATLPRPAPKPRPAVKPPNKPPVSAPAPQPPLQTSPPSDALASPPPQDGPMAPAAAPPPTEALAAADAQPTPQPQPESAAAPEPAPRPRDAAAPVSVNTSNVPKAVKLRYQVDANKFPYRLSGELLWVPDEENQYVASLSFGAFGQTRTQTSRGQVGPQGLMPERFSDKFRSEVAAHFNRAQGKVTFSANTPDAPLLQGAQDRLSVLIQLAAMVASAPERFPPATTLTIQTVGPRDADLWLFTVSHTETLVLPGGTVQALKLTRNPRQPYDQQVDIWLAPALGYLPARIRITEANGDAIDQKWTASEPVDRP